ncbi:hypothetical protein [Sphaerotilus montanus]|uniref:hypothetical protein n=1 Tax=Sphaerotilus montanus TaxID=522889 RepID=UPI003FA2EBC7
MNTTLRTLGAVLALCTATAASAHPGHDAAGLLHTLSDATLPLALVAIGVLALDGGRRKPDSAPPSGAVQRVLGARGHLLAIGTVAAVALLTMLAHL